jgi:RNA polymerase sigma factor
MMGVLHKNKDKNNLQKEIVTYKKILDEYKISFSDLTSCPATAQKRMDAKNIAKLISENDLLASMVKEKKKLPVKELKRLFSNSHRTISKYKKYIIAVTLLYMEEFTNLRNYVNL